MRRIIVDAHGPAHPIDYLRVAREPILKGDAELVRRIATWCDTQLKQDRIVYQTLVKSYGAGVPVWYYIYEAFLSPERNQ